MRIRTALVAASLVTAGILGTAGSASADGDGTRSVTGNGSKKAIGNFSTKGDKSPQLGLVQGSLNDVCAAVPVKANVGSLIGAIPVTAQDINVLSSPQNQQCTENSTQAKGDEPLSHLVHDVPVLSGNGKANDVG